MPRRPKPSRKNTPRSPRKKPLKEGLLERFDLRPFIEGIGASFEAWKSEWMERGRSVTAGESVLVLAEDPTLLKVLVGTDANSRNRVAQVMFRDDFAAMWKGQPAAVTTVNTLPREGLLVISACWHDRAQGLYHTVADLCFTNEAPS